MSASESDRSLSNELDQLRKSRVRRGIVLPFSVALIVVLGFSLTAFALPSPVQVAALSDTALTLLLLFPAALCLFPLVILSIALVALMARWGRGGLSPLRRLEGLAESMERNADRWLGGIDRRILEWAVAFAPIRQALRTFDTMGDETTDGDES